MIKRLLLLSIAIANLHAQPNYSSLPVKEMPQSDMNLINWISREILKLQRIKTPTAKALLAQRMRQLREILNDYKAKED